MRNKYIPRSFTDYNQQNFLKKIIIKIVNKYWKDHFNVDDNNRKRNVMSFIKNKLDTIFFNYINAPEIINGESYLSFVNHPMRELKYGFYTIPGIIIEPDEKVSSKIEIKKGLVILGGIAILDKYLKSVSDYHLTIYIKIFNTKDISKSFKFTIPVNRYKTLLKSIGSYTRNEEFVEFKINVDELNLEDGVYSIEVIGKYSNINKHIIENSDLPGIVIKSPQIVNGKSKSETKNILIIGLESLTDPFWLMQKNQENLDLVGINQIISDGVYYNNSYAQQDATLPFMTSFMTGLYSSQHLLADYKKPLYKSQLNPNYKTLSQILKEKGFLTDAITPMGRCDTSYGWAKGYDSFVVSPNSGCEAAPNSGNLTRLISKNAGFDSFTFAHIDRVHLPIAKFLPSQSPQIFDLQALSDANVKNFYPLLFKQIQALDKIIYDVIQTLKYESIYENTLIILTGDHGIAVPPKWKKNLNFPLYEEHIRVPYIIKWPEWCKQSEINNIVDTPHNATVDIFMKVLKSLDIELPEYFNNSSQLNEKYNGYAFTETIFHPHNYYAVSIVSDNIKYWMKCKMDWDNLTMQKVSDEKLFFRGSNGFINENNDKINSSRKERDYFNEIGIEFLKDNLSFYKERNNILH